MRYTFVKQGTQCSICHRQTNWYVIVNAGRTIGMLTVCRDCDRH